MSLLLSHFMFPIKDQNGGEIMLAFSTFRNLKVSLGILVVRIHLHNKIGRNCLC
jgi:hypothetical protein